MLIDKKMGGTSVDFSRQLAKGLGIVLAHLSLSSDVTAVEAVVSVEGVVAVVEENNAASILAIGKVMVSSSDGSCCKR